MEISTQVILDDGENHTQKAGGPSKHAGSVQKDREA